MKKNKILTLLIIAVSLACTSVHSQEISLQGSFGISGLNYKLDKGKTHLQSGGSVGLGYKWFLTERWGLLSGLNLGLYRNNSNLNDGVTFMQYLVDDLGSAFEYRVKTIGYIEKQHSYLLSVPLMLQYHTGGKVRMYVNAGGKAYFPLLSRSTAAVDQLLLTAYFPDMNIEVNNLPQHGFGTINGWQSTSKDKLAKVSYGLSAEVGVSFPVTQKSRLYTGIFADYGLTAV